MIKKQMNVKIVVNIVCKHCGLPISKTSEWFGMDCVNDCGFNEYTKNASKIKE